ncbi:MAG TPA: PDZ domain-containing protein [Polyangia bacterium]|nr:PDZ domain-containing protein [Polyangia bacterium]
MNTRRTPPGGGTGGAEAGGEARRSSAGRAVDKTPEPREIVASRRRRRRLSALALVLVVLAATAAIVWSVVEDARESRGDAEPRSQAASEGTESRSDEDEPRRVERRVRPRTHAPAAPPVAAPVPEGSNDLDAAVPEVSSVVATPPAPGAARARAAPAPSAPRAAKHADGGAPAASDPDGGAKRAVAARRPGQEPSQSEEERGLQQVDRFVATGGATLEGRVVEADGDKPVAGTSVHVHHAGMFVGARTDASGAFRIPGMLPGSRVVVWVGRNDDAFVDERIAVSVPEDGQAADAGTVKLLRGDELSAHLLGWVGVFVTRRSGQIVVSAVSPWLPADRAGIEVGDQILAIDGRDTTGLGPRAVTFLLRGPVDAPVSLLVRTLDHDKRKLVLDRVLR